MQFSHQQSATIKQQTIIESTLSGRFISIMSRTQQHLSKDLIFELIEIFYQNNSIFLQLFERSFLLVFESSCSSQNIKNYPDQSLKNFNDLLTGFLKEMIKMEFQVTKSDQQQEYFQNFVDYFIVFFAQGLTSKKCSVKEFSFSVLVSSLQIFNQYLELDLYPQTQNQLTESIFYLLLSKPDEQKLMAIELYLLLRKINFRSAQIQTLLEEMLETTQSFKVRRTIIQHAYFLKQHNKLDFKKLDKLMQRLNDKNPLIIEEVIDKLIRQKIHPESLKFGQRIQILIQGFGSCFENVKHKSLQYFAGYLKELFEEESVPNQKLIAEGKHNELDNSYLDPVEQINAIQKFMRIFNSDLKQVEFLSIFRSNPFVSKLIYQLIFSTVFDQHGISITKTRTNRIIQKIQTSSCTSEQFIYLFSILSRLQQASTIKKSDKIIRNVLQFRRYLTSEMKLPNLVDLSKTFVKLLKQPPNVQNLTSLMFFIKIMKILIIDLDLHDFASKKSFVDQMYTILNECDFFESEQETKPESKQGKTQMESIQKQKIITNQLLKVCSFLNQRKNDSSYEVVTCRPDLLLLILQLVYLLNENMTPSCIDYRQTIKDLLESKQLRLERETIMKMLKKAENMKNSTIKQVKQRTEKNSIQEQQIPNAHIVEIKQEIQKKLDKVETKIRSNQTKAFLILAKLLSLESSKESKSIQASQFLDQIKAYLYYTPTNVTDKQEDNLLFMPYLLLYHYSLEKKENFICFKKLFYFYAFEDYSDSQAMITKQIILRVVNFRLLLQLEMKNLSLSYNLSISNQQAQKSALPFLIEATFKRLENSKNTLTFERNLYFEIALKLTFTLMKFKDSQFSSKTNLYIFKLILFTLESTIINQQNLIIRLFMIKINELPQEFKTKIFWHIFVFYKSFSTFIKAKETNKENYHSNHLILQKICKVISNFFKLLSITNCIEDKNNIHAEVQSLQRFILLCKFLQKGKNSFSSIIPLIINFRLKNMFPSLFNKETRNDYIEDTSEDHQFLIELSLLSRKQIQNLTQLIRVLSKQLNLQQQRSIQIILDQIARIDQCLEIKISNFVKCNHKQGQEQQSTDNSEPLEIYRNNEQLKQQKKFSSRVDLEKITQYEQTITLKLSIINKETEDILKIIKKSDLLESFVTNFQEKYQVQLHPQANNHISELKLESDQHIGSKKYYSHMDRHELVESDNILNGQNKLNLSTETERKHKSVYIECDKLTAWIKKSSLIGIPFEIIENVQKKLKVKHQTGKRRNRRSIKREKGKSSQLISMQPETDVENSSIFR